MKKENIPNYISVFRLLLVPLFAVVYFKVDNSERVFANVPKSSFWAAVIYTVAGISDIVDGYLARKNNWITNSGKILDPLADKLMQAAVIICIMIKCISNKNMVFIWIAVLFFVKEILMVVGASVILRKKKAVVASSWYGKMSTSVFYAVTIIYMLFRPDRKVTLLLTLILASAMIFALVMYYLKTFRGRYGITKLNVTSNNDADIKYSA